MYKWVDEETQIGSDAYEGKDENCACEKEHGKACPEAIEHRMIVPPKGLLHAGKIVEITLIALAVVVISADRVAAANRSNGAL